MHIQSHTHNHIHRQLNLKYILPLYPLFSSFSLFQKSLELSFFLLLLLHAYYHGCMWDAKPDPADFFFTSFAKLAKGDALLPHYTNCIKCTMIFLIENSTFVSCTDQHLFIHVWLLCTLFRCIQGSDILLWHIKQISTIHPTFRLAQEKQHANAQY